MVTLSTAKGLMRSFTEFTLSVGMGSERLFVEFILSEANGLRVTEGEGFRHLRRARSRIRYLHGGSTTGSP